MPYPVIPIQPPLVQGDPLVPTQKADVLAVNTPPTLAQEGEVVAISPANTGLPVNTPAIVQKAANVSTSGVASLTKAFTSNNVAGNSIVVVCAVGNGTAATVTDSAGNTYNAVNNAANSTTFSAQIFYATGILAGANTVTVTPSASVSVAMEIYEVSGLLAQVPVQPEQNATNFGTGTTASTANLTPVHPNELFFAGVAVGTAAQTITPIGAWTNDSGQQTVGGTPSGLYSFVSMSQYRGGLGTITPDATIASSEPWAMAVASFRGVAINVSGTVALSPATSGLPVNLPGIVQKAKAVSSGGVASLTCAFANNNIAANSIIVSVGIGNNGANTISDTNGNTYYKAVLQANSTTFEAGIYFATNILGGPNTITVTPSASVSVAIQIYEVSGLIAQAGSILDQTASTTGTGTATTTPVVLPGSPNEYAFAAVAVGTAVQATSVTSGTFWSLDSTQNIGGSPSGVFSFGALSQPLSNISTLYPQATIAGSEPWSMAVATFRPVVLGVQGAMTLVPPYPSLATAVTADSGNVAAGTCTATLTAVAGKTMYITGYTVTGSGASSATVVTGTVTGVITGTLHFTVAVPGTVTTGITPLTVTFPYPIPASATNTNIVVSTPTFGSGNTNVTINAYGFYM